MGKIIGVISLKGGVGKTSSVVALGDAIANFDRKVLLVDANFSAPNLGLHLNIINPDKTLQQVLAREINVKDAICDLGHLDVIPSSLTNRTKINFFKLKDKIRPLKRRYDIILIDSSPALNEETLAVMLASDNLLAVTTPDYSTLGTTVKAVKLAKRRGTPVLGLILNKVYSKNFELSLDEIERTAEVPVLAVIPHDVGVLKAQSEFTPSTVHKPNSEVSKEYKKLAATLIGEKYKPRFSVRDLLRLGPKRQDINREIFYNRVFE